MVVTIDKLKIAYFPVPKAANTSMKHLMHSIDTGGKFRTKHDEATGHLHHIHREYKTPKFSAINPGAYNRFFKIAIVRDPVERIISAWRNRVVHHKELEDEKCALSIKEIGLPEKPDLSEFVLHLDEYREINKSISVHTAPLTDFLGTSREYYDLIFDISESHQIEVFFSTLTGEKKKLPRKQTGGPPAERDKLPEDLIRKLEHAYESDYRVFGGAFGKQTDLKVIAKRAKRHRASLRSPFRRFRWVPWI
ncbi:sulfotransferase family 2 domain-containing protein [Shinella sp. S4-D37]|uniref:sulfotransferase family 2 domain-containing protein n=1 Tax=Shinella sp. S4-D37 TaxID=3161999 RepID=UPI003465CA4C